MQTCDSSGGFALQAITGAEVLPWLPLSSTLPPLSNIRKCPGAFADFLRHQIQPRLPIMISFRLGTSFTAPAGVLHPCSSKSVKEGGTEEGHARKSSAWRIRGLPWSCWRPAALAFQRRGQICRSTSKTCNSNDCKACTFSRTSPLHLEVDGISAAIHLQCFFFDTGTARALLHPATQASLGFQKGLCQRAARPLELVDCRQL